MSRFASPKTAQIWAESIAMCERSNAAVSQYYQSNRKLAAAPHTSVFLRVQASEPTMDTIEIKLLLGNLDSCSGIGR